MGRFVEPSIYNTYPEGTRIYEGVLAESGSHSCSVALLFALSGSQGVLGPAIGDTDSCSSAHFQFVVGNKRGCLVARRRNERLVWCVVVEEVQGQKT